MQDARGASLSDADAPGTTDAAPRAASLRGFPAALVAIAVAVVTLDQVAKEVVLHQLSGHAPVQVIGGFLQLRLVRNAGAAFGLASGATIVFSLVAAVVVVAILRTARRLRSAGWTLALGLILGGAVGNLVDRIIRDPGVLRGHVVDFLELPHWPVFNLADSSICVGAAVIVLLSLRGVPLDGRAGD